MTKKFAVLDGDNVINTILCDSKSLAEEITNKTCIEYTTEPAEPGGTYVDGQFRQRKPYPSWIFVDNKWNAPVEYPIGDGPFIWNEETTSWTTV